MSAGPAATAVRDDVSAAPHSAAAKGEAMRKFQSRRFLGAAAGLVCALVTGVVAAAPARAAYPGRNGRIGFVGDHYVGPTSNNQFDIFTVRPDGTGVRRLTRTHDAWSLAWGPYGRRILYLRNPFGGPVDVWMMHADGSHKVRVLRGSLFKYGRVGCPSWAPGGNRFVFCALGRAPGTETTDQLYVYRLATGQVRQLTHLTVDDTYGMGGVAATAWSPRGDRVTFQVTTLTDEEGGDSTDLFTIALDGSHQRQITTTGADHAPAWSPRGLRIADFSGWDGDTSTPAEYHGLVIMRPDGGVVRHIRGVGDGRPAWSPNGRWIATARPFWGTNGQNNDPKPGLWLLRPDGSDAHRIITTRTPTNDIYDVDWQPLPTS